jgi:hypothetical protein
MANSPLAVFFAFFASIFGANVPPVADKTQAGLFKCTRKLSMDFRPMSYPSNLKPATARGGNNLLGFIHFSLNFPTMAGISRPALCVSK